MHRRPAANASDLPEPHGLPDQTDESHAASTHDPSYAAWDEAIDGDDIASNPSALPTLGQCIQARLSRRGAMGSMLAAAAGTSLATGCVAQSATPPKIDKLEKPQGADADTDTTPGPSTLQFEEIENVITDSHRVSKGYNADVLIRWGDPVLADAPPFDPAKQTAAGQAKQFGYNNDFIAFMPLPRGSDRSDHGLLCVSHEYTRASQMWPGIKSLKDVTAEQSAVEMAAHGHSIIEIKRNARGKWRVVENSQYARRITTSTTSMVLAGPAAGHRRLQTTADPTGKQVIGTVNNCAGGVTPWGTVLIAEENFNKYFVGDPKKMPASEQAAAKRYGLGKAEWFWGRYHRRFHLEKEPNEVNRFGWMVEFDPYDPKSVPVKRTALGRFRHEGATSVLNKDGRVVVYSGDDQHFEYVYKYVSRGKYDPAKPESREGLLDDGTLHVAKFSDDGACAWRPLVFGQGPLTAKNGFQSQADVLIEARRAADLLGATPMDRPEDVEPNPASGKVYIMLTNNTRRRVDQLDKVNPRPANRFGHIVELVPPGAEDGNAKAADHAASTFHWNVFLRAGNPDKPEDGAVYHPDVSKDGWLACPDNCAFDHHGRLWVATDQGSTQKGRGIPDGMRACDTAGDGRALTKLFFAAPRDAEMCGPCFTPDSKTLFVAVQHPAEGTPYEKPSTRWPDFDDKLPPRPSVVAITKQDGGEIGG